MPLYANITKQFEDKVIEVFEQSDSNICRITCMISLSSSSSTEGMNISSSFFSGVDSIANTVKGVINGWSVGGSGSANSFADNSSISGNGYVGYQITPMKILTFNITQNFETEYMEKITATFDVSIDEAITILSNYQDLRCTMIFDHVTQHYYRVIDEIPSEIREFTMLIPAPDDILKKLLAVEAMIKKQIDEAKARGEHIDDDVRVLRFQLPAELVSVKRYDLKGKPTNFILEEADMRTAVHMFANSLGIKKVSMVPPDNPKQYKNIIAPPMQTMESFITLLQSTYGIYKKGVGYYYDDKNEVLRVYPLYETDPQPLNGVNKPEVSDLNLWRVPKSSYPGSSSYHAVRGGTMEIILNGEMEVRELSKMGVELNGNVQVAVRSDTVVDVNTTQKDKEAEVNKDNQLLVGSMFEKVATKSRSVAKYIGNTNNAYIMASNMAATMCAIMSATWDMAWPWIITSGHRLRFNYEDYGGTKQTTGIVSGVEYSATAIAGVITHELYYAWKAILHCRLAVDQEMLSGDLSNPDGIVSSVNSAGKSNTLPGSTSQTTN